MGILIFFHATICILLIIIIMIQAGRGGGLVEGFSGVESMFGPKTSVFLTKLTSICSTLFLISCVSLAVLSARQSRSLLRNAGVGKIGANAAANQTVSQSPEEPVKAAVTNATQTSAPAANQTVNQGAAKNK